MHDHAYYDQLAEDVAITESDEYCLRARALLAKIAADDARERWRCDYAGCWPTKEES